MNQITYITFYITYVLLITTGTITFIEALSTHNPTIRHIMNIETCISIVAAYFYTIFIKHIDQRPYPFKKITHIRYADWLITTPLMILSLCLVISFNTKQKLHLSTLALLILLDYGMIITGYLGEINKINRKVADIIGFVFFALLFGVIWYTFLRNNNSRIAWITFLTYLFVWSFYGIAYLFNDEIKNTIFNILDLIAKCLVGIFFWMYFTKIVVI